MATATRGSPADTPIGRAQEVFNGVLFLMSESKPEKRISTFKQGLEYFIVLFDAFQLAGFIISRFGYDEGVVSSISEALSVWRALIPTGNPTYFFVSWALAIFAAGVCLGNAAYVSYMLHSDDLRHMWPVYSLRSLVTTLVTFGYLPFLELMALPLRCEFVRGTYDFSGYTCWSGVDIWMPILSLTTMFLFVPLALALSASHYEKNPYISNPAARASGRFDFLVTFVRTLMVVFTFTMSSVVAESVIVFIFLFLLTATVILFYPYFEPRMNALRCALFSMLTSLCLFGFILLMGRDTWSPDAYKWTTVVALAIQPAFFTLGWKISKKRANVLQKVALALEANKANVADLQTNHIADALGSQIPLPRPGRRSSVASSLSGFRALSTGLRGDEDDDFSVIDEDSQVPRATTSSGVGPRRMDLHVQRRNRRPSRALQPANSEMSKSAERAGQSSPGNEEDGDVGSAESAGSGSNLLAGTMLSRSTAGDATPGSAPRKLGPVVPPPSLRVTLNKAPIVNETPVDEEQPAPVLASFIERRIEPTVEKMPELISAADIEILVRFIILRPVVPVESLRLAQDLYEKGLAMFPFSAFLMQQYAAFLMLNSRKPQAAQQALIQVEALGPSIDLQFQIFSARRTLMQQEQASNLGRQSLDATAMLEYRKHSKAARRAHLAALKDMERLWRAASIGKVSGIETIVNKISTGTKHAEDSYNKLLDLFPQFPSILREVALFKQHVLHAPARDIKSMYALADEREEAADKVSEVDAGEQALADGKPPDVSLTQSQGSSSRASADGDNTHFVPAITEALARSTTTRAVAIAMVVLIIVYSVTFAVAMTTMTFLNGSDMDLAGLRRKLTSSCIYETRWMSLASMQSSTSIVDVHRASLKKEMASLRTLHTKLYDLSDGNEHLANLYNGNTELVTIRTFNPESTADRAVGVGVLVNATFNGWEAFNEMALQCNQVSVLTEQKLNNTREAHVRFVYDNVYPTVIPLARRMAQVYQDDVFEHASDNVDIMRWLFLANLGVGVLLALTIGSLAIPAVVRLENKGRNAKLIVGAVSSTTFREMALAARRARKEFMDPARAQQDEYHSDDEDHPQGRPDVLTPTVAPEQKEETYEADSSGFVSRGKGKIDGPPTETGKDVEAGDDPGSKVAVANTHERRKQTCSGMSLRTSVAARLFLFTATAAIMATLFFDETASRVNRARYFSSDINNAGFRRFLSRYVNYLALETMRGDGQVMTRIEAAKDLEDTLALFRRVHTGLSSGDDDRKLLGSDGRDHAQDALLYTNNCLRSDCTTEDTRSFAETAAQGLDALLRLYLDAASRIHGEFSTSSASLELSDMLANDDFALMVALETSDLGKGLAKSMTLYVAESEAFIAASKSATEQLFALTLGAIILAYLLFLRAVPKQLTVAGEGSRAMLRLFPQKVIRTSTRLQEFYVEEQNV